MKNNLSSDEALKLLRRWKRESSVIDVVCNAEDPTSFWLRGAKISQLSEQAIVISNEKGLLNLPLENVTFKQGNTEILAFDVPVGMSIPFAKSCLQVKTAILTATLLEMGLIQKAPSSLV